MLSTNNSGSSGLYLTTAYFRTSLFRDSLLYQTFQYNWNAVPGDIKTETTLSSFKAKLKSFCFVICLVSSDF